MILLRLRSLMSCVLWSLLWRWWWHSGNVPLASDAHAQSIGCIHKQLAAVLPHPISSTSAPCGVYARRRSCEIHKIFAVMFVPFGVVRCRSLYVCLWLRSVLLRFWFFHAIFIWFYLFFIFYCVVVVFFEPDDRSLVGPVWPRWLDQTAWLAASHLLNALLFSLQSFRDFLYRSFSVAPIALQATKRSPDTSRTQFTTFLLLLQWKT